jgi:hypothetical protein
MEKQQYLDMLQELRILLGITHTTVNLVEEEMSTECRHTTPIALTVVSSRLQAELLKLQVHTFHHKLGSLKSDMDDLMKQNTSVILAWQLLDLEQILLIFGQSPTLQELLSPHMQARTGLAILVLCVGKPVR